MTGTARERDRAPRLGPRPLPLHLATAFLAAMTSRSALPLLSNGSLAWSPQLATRAAGLSAGLASADPDALAAAVTAAAASWQHQVLDGIAAYRGHPHRRALEEPPTVWRDGAARLLDFAPLGGGGLPLLVVPSLINRAYVLDLTPASSLMRWLASRGYRPFLMDWGRPGARERAFDLTGYVTGPLEGALDRVLALAGRPPVLAGYCMGGLLALAAALRRQDELAGLALLATPWDFHAGDGARARLLGAALKGLEPVLETLGELPVDPIQALFARLDPLAVPRKFAAFARLDPQSAAARAFVVLEDWLNDGVPLAAPVARECLTGWYGENSTARGRWRVAGRPVAPAAIRLPTLCLIPGEDRIVPPASAAALADAIPDARAVEVRAGHIGMVAGGRGRIQARRALGAWLAERR